LSARATSVPRRTIANSLTATTHRDAEHWKTLYQKGMRVLVEGRTVRDEWEDADENERVTFKVEARRVGILPYRIESVALSTKPAGGQ